ncbi:MAG: BREX-1 system adenine-specific DNA-methyltransferase PglX [Synergistaceae bacterium]|nr:BREX-1 system adenine-specific DNA-methyltransferase PglX [Synergistaceae bacterium]
MENVACTWFNRLIALRIMEVNDWLPSNIRILSSREPGRAEPDAMREVESLDYVSQPKIAELRTDTDINASEKLYKYILISQCNALSALLPGMFQKEHDYTELLLPDALLAGGGIVNELVTTIHENNFDVDKQGQIEIVGWLYQFYISEKKDEVFLGLKKNIKINKDTIAAATQLFTPEWIVKYMVENSLGRLWLDTHPNVDLRSKWKYYVDEVEQEPEVAEQIRVLRSQSPVRRLEDIKLIDPCMGSGHILVYAFDVLFQIYQSEGYSERDIPNLILKNNLYGLDIDDRAGQLAYFALMIKARSYNRRFLQPENIPQPMVYAVPETKIDLIGIGLFLGASMTESEKIASSEDLKYLVELFSKGKEYGSAMKIELEINYERLRKYIHDYSLGQMTFEHNEFVQHAEYLDHMIDVAAVLSRKYDVVVTNPPYMSASNMNSALYDFTQKVYSNSKSDLFSVFIEKYLLLSKMQGCISMITMRALNRVVGLP